MADDVVPTGTFESNNSAGITNADAELVPSNYEICQRSGFKVRLRDDLGRETGDLVQQWDGLWVKRDFRDKRNPQELIKVTTKEKSKGAVRPEPADEYITTAVTAADL